MTGLYYLNVTVHLLAAIFWLGGMLFIAAVGAPVLREVESPAERSALFRRLGERFRVTGWTAIAALLVTGTLNLHFRGLLRWQTLTSGSLWATGYGQALAWKLAAVSVMLVASGLHDFVLGPRAARLDPTSTQGARARRRASLLARLNALVGLVVVTAAVRLARGG